MAVIQTALERRLYTALKRITQYDKPERLLKKSWDDWGLEDGAEALSMAYENIQSEAASAIKGVRLPRPTPNGGDRNETE